jgi:cytoskeletal protein CcmA (bactofilin family)
MLVKRWRLIIFVKNTTTAASVMFKKSGNMAKYTENEPGSSTINIIGTGTSIVGNVNSDGDIRIDGTLKGDLATAGKVVIGPSGVITGKINCRNADISGTVEGKINVSELLSLKASAKIFGDIATNKLAIEPNAVFTGTCNMNGNSGTYDKQSEERFKEIEEPAQ